jgi:large conductance mechanosensitive channel
MLKDFKEFAIKGNALDLAVGVIIGAAFTTVVNSLVYDIFTPFLSLFTGWVDFSKWTIGLPGDAVLKPGAFISAIINFLIIAFAVFLMVKQINRFRRQASASTDKKECPFCRTVIDLRASKCPKCTSQLA